MKLENFRIFLASWLILPLILVWMSTNYLVGLNRHPVWEVTDTPHENTEVLGKFTESGESDIQKIHWTGQGMVTLWFDDAWVSQFTVAYPMLEEKGMVGSLAVPTGMIGFDDYMSWNQIRLLQYKGWEINSHTIHHSCDPNELTPEYVEHELSGALEELNAHGIRALHFVTPCGLVSDLYTVDAKKYYLSLRTTIDGFNELPIINPYGLKVQAVEWKTTPEDIQRWVDEAKEKHYWLILMFHQIQKDESRFATTPQNLSKILDIIQNSGLQTVLPTQATQLIVDRLPEPPPTPTLIPTPAATIRILRTPTGYLRVRDNPRANAKTVAQVKPGDTYKLLDTVLDWYLIEIKTETGTSGWVSKNYTEVLN